ncbi:hypothetical protein B0H16DRAFT_1467616 [Mycena metata]|uniref:Uncharacterized protein n=1 Tax=Mycena metata TaxID=1033252 RepID=A0AAD7I4V3_9AGAR|nr:hypothetical protein B0H16DRAFT_1467616 [Mycena metata]
MPGTLPSISWVVSLFGAVFWVTILFPYLFEYLGSLRPSLFDFIALIYPICELTAFGIFPVMCNVHKAHFGTLQLSHMNKRDWDLTPSDTNPIEGSHAQDNKMNDTGRSLLEAVLLAKKSDRETAQVIMATLASGVLENGNNSLQARFSNKSHRDARTQGKRQEAEALSGREARKLRQNVKSKEDRVKNAELEILDLRRQIEALAPGQISPPQTPVAGPSNSNRAISLSPDIDTTHHSLPAFRMAALNLFPGIRPLTPIPEPRSDFDYAAALNSDVLDATLQRIVDSHPMYPVDGMSDDEILASDPHPIV